MAAAGCDGVTEDAEGHVAKGEVAFIQHYGRAHLKCPIRRCKTPARRLAAVDRDRVLPDGVVPAAIIPDDQPPAGTRRLAAALRQTVNARYP